MDRAGSATTQCHHCRCGGTVSEGSYQIDDRLRILNFVSEDLLPRRGASCEADGCGSTPCTLEKHPINELVWLLGGSPTQLPCCYHTMKLQGKNMVAQYPRKEIHPPYLMLNRKLSIVKLEGGSLTAR